MKTEKQMAMLNLQSGGKAEDMKGASRNPSGLTCSQIENSSY